jgi:cell division inhibitor SulA
VSETSYDVKVWKIETYRGSRTTSYRVRWLVAGRMHRETLRTAALADAFRSELVQAARRGEAFGIESGRPVSMERAERQVSWFDFAREYAVMKCRTWRRTRGATPHGR